MPRRDTTSVAVPLPVGKEAHAKATIPAAHAADATKTATITLEESFDGGVTWQDGVTATWQGGLVIPSGKPNAGQRVHPHISCNYGRGRRPTHIRSRVNLEAGVVAIPTADTV